MTMKFVLVTGSEVTLDRDNLSIVREFRATDVLPVSMMYDYFDVVSTHAIGWITANAPTYLTPLGLLYWNTIQIHEDYYGLHYTISVTYTPVKKAVGAYQITVDQTGGSVNVTAGKVIAAFGANKPATLAETPGTIGVQGDAVNGIDIPIEQTKLNIMFRHPSNFLNATYIKAIGRLVGYPNEDGFLTYDPGEVLYLGGNFTETDTESSASYSFAVSYNATNFTVDGITIGDKKGWDVLDPVYADDEEDGKPVRKVDYFKTIRPAGREWKDYRTVFGWGGTP